MDVFINGIFRSGTNLVRTLLEWNFDVRVVNNAFGWKHGFLPIVTADSILKLPAMRGVFVTKNPFSAINSLYRYYKTNGNNILAESEWSEFLRGRILLFDSHQDRSPQFRFDNPVALWNAMNWNYSSVMTQDLIAHVRYEDVIANCDATIGDLGEELELKRKTPGEEIVLPARTLRNMKDTARKSAGDYVTREPFERTTEYAAHGYMTSFAPGDIEFVAAWLDRELVERLGYAALTDSLGGAS